MNHLSFFWLPKQNHHLIQMIENEFHEMVSVSISSGKIVLPPIPAIVLDIQQLCTLEDTTVFDVAESLLQDPGLTAVVIRIANTVIFNHRNIVIKDITTAVSRLGIMRVRDIVTAQAIEQLKHSLNLSPECNVMLRKSATKSRELAATMALVVQSFHSQSKDKYRHLEADKALLVGLLADIGLFCLVSEYNLYQEQGNYLDKELALQIFESHCSKVSKMVLSTWGFDRDFIEVSSNQPAGKRTVDVSYLDVARIANHLLLFRYQDSAIEEHEVEIDAAGAEVLFQLSNLSDTDFNAQIKDVINSAGM
jgi:HD-like signal output (HDOD) protein